MRNTLIILIGLMLFACKASDIQQKNFIMESNNNVDSLLIVNQLDIDAYFKNKGDALYYAYSLPNGTEIKITDSNFRKSEGEKYRTFYMKTTPAKPCFYTLMQTFYYNGKIKERGCYLQSDLKIGTWEYYDEHGNKTEVNEDLGYPEFSYNDVLLFLHKENLVNVYTGQNREKITMAYYERPYWEKEPKPLWVVDWIDDKETFTQIIYHLDAKTGKVVAKGKGNSGSQTIILK